jgi:hypothetical protein
MDNYFEDISYLLSICIAFSNNPPFVSKDTGIDLQTCFIDEDTNCKYIFVYLFIFFLRSIYFALFTTASSDFESHLNISVENCFIFIFIFIF